VIVEYHPDVAKHAKLSHHLQRHKASVINKTVKLIIWNCVYVWM